MNHSRRIAIATTVIFVGLLAVFGILYAINHQQPQDMQGSKSITVAVVVSQEQAHNYTLQTDQEFLLGVLQEYNLIEGVESSAGFFITAVDGVAADSSKQQWWCITKGGEAVMTGVSGLPIADGDGFELTLTVGW